MKGKYEAPVQKKNSKKGVALLLVLFLLVGCVIGGTLAWLQDQTSPVVDTFTYGNVDIELYEGDTKTTLWSAAQNNGTIALKMIPGQTITFNPYVNVKAGSEDCYLFVKVESSLSANVDGKAFSDYITLTMGDGWTALNGVNNVYYREAAANDNVPVISGDKVAVPNGVKAADFEALGTASAEPTVSITAYAVQKDATFATAKDAWTAASFT